MTKSFNFLFFEFLAAFVLSENAIKDGKIFFEFVIKLENIKKSKNALDAEQLLYYNIVN